MQTRRMFGRSLIGLVAIGAGLAALPALAASKTELVIAARSTNSSIDPHFQWLPISLAINQQIFEPLVRADENGVFKPLLAKSWSRENDTTWIFKLRQNVKFSDGSPFTADDVVFTYTRARSVPNAPTNFSAYLNQIKEASAVDANTLKLVTVAPSPTLLENLAQVLIVSKKYGENATTADYNTGKATIGTGPFKFVSWVTNDNTVLTRNPNYWGAAPKWEKVTYRIIINDAARLAALLSGDVDVMQGVPPEDVQRAKGGKGVQVWSRSGNWPAYTAIDVEKALESGALTGPNDEKLDKNPLADIRVRKALRLAVDYEAVAKRLYLEEAIPAGQFVSEGMVGFNPDLKPVKANLDEAKKLMKEAGYEAGFKTTLSAAAGYFPQIGTLAEIIAQSWARIGVKATVQVVPTQVYAAQRAQRKLPMFVSAYQNPANGPDSMFGPILHSRDVKTGAGVFNFSFYSNPEVDKLIDQAALTFDASRGKLYEKAAELAVNDFQTVPIFYFKFIDATGPGIKLTQRFDNMLMPAHIEPPP